MALTFPYPLAFFSDFLRVRSSRVRLQRYDELSGGGDGRTWAAQMAAPLWSADIKLSDCPAAIARETEARIDGLDGSQRTFLFADPAYRGPASGVTTGLDAVTISGIRGTDRGAIALTGLPKFFVLTAGDYLSINYASGRVYFGQFSEGGSSGNGVSLGQKEIRPYLPFGISVGATVELVRPAFKAFIIPGGYTPYDYDLPHGEIARGGSMSIRQRP